MLAKARAPRRPRRDNTPAATAIRRAHEEKNRVRNLMKVLIVACSLYWLPALHAAEPAAGKAAQSSEVASPEQAGVKEEKKGGFSIFWIVFLVSILFVLSSATALNRLGGKPPPRGKGGAPRPRKKAANDERRFRL